MGIRTVSRVGMQGFKEAKDPYRFPLPPQIIPKFWGTQERLKIKLNSRVPQS